MKRLLLHVAVWTGLSGLCHPLDAFELFGTQWPQGSPGDPVHLTYSFNNFLDGGLVDPSLSPVPVMQLRGAIEEAFSVWASVAPLHFAEVADQGGTVAHFNYPEGQYGIIRIGHHSIDGFGSFKAHAFFPPSPASTLDTLAGDVHFDNADRWQLVGTLAEPDILGAAIHEIGHTLGLAHSAVSHDFSSNPPIFNGAAMFPTFRRHAGPGTGSLHQDDIAGIQTLYGVGTGTVTPLPVPEPGAMVCCVVGLLILNVTRTCRG